MGARMNKQTAEDVYRAFRRRRRGAMENIDDSVDVEGHGDNAAERHLQRQGGGGASSGDSLRAKSSAAARTILSPTATRSSS